MEANPALSPQEIPEEIAMAREPDWKAEIREALRHEPWSSTGPQRLMKVVRFRSLMNAPAHARAVGYVTQELYLFGKTPTDIERALGLPPFSFGRGCRVFHLERLPMRGEYTDELTADMPGGLAFNPADALEARYRYENDQSMREVPYYPPGDKWIPQWNVTVAIPLKHIMDLAPTITYPRPSDRR
jgi:hypothetical protein